MRCEAVNRFGYKKGFTFWNPGVLMRLSPRKGGNTYQSIREIFMNIKSALMAVAFVAGSLQASVAFAADPVAATKDAVKEAVTATQAPAEGKQMKKKREGNPRMKECAAEFKTTGKKSSERKAFMSECLKKPKA